MLSDIDRSTATNRLTRHMSSDYSSTAYGTREIETRLNEVDRKVTAWWESPSSDATRWLALGLDILFNLDFGHSSRPRETREQVSDRFHKAVVNGNSHDTSAWSDADIALGKAWLAISSYTLWQIIEDAREAGISEVENIMFEAVRERADGTSVSKAIEATFRKGVMNWHEAGSNRPPGT